VIFINLLFNYIIIKDNLLLSFAVNMLLRLYYIIV